MSVTKAVHRTGRFLRVRESGDSEYTRDTANTAVAKTLPKKYPTYVHACTPTTVEAPQTLRSSKQRIETLRDTRGTADTNGNKWLVELI